MRVEFGFAKNPKLLAYHGPSLKVEVGFDKTWNAADGGRPHSRGFDLEALVDTGAQESCIDRLLAAELKLPVCDRQSVCGVGGVQEVEVFLAQIYLPRLNFTNYGKFAGVTLKESGHRQHILLGRDFLAHFVLTYDGLTGLVSLSSTSD